MPWCSVSLHFIFLHFIVRGTYSLYPFCECVWFLLCLEPACKTRVAELGPLWNTGKEILFENRIKRKKGGWWKSCSWGFPSQDPVKWTWMEDPGFPRGGRISGLAAVFTSRGKI